MRWLASRHRLLSHLPRLAFCQEVSARDPADEREKVVWAAHEHLTQHRRVIVLKNLVGRYLTSTHETRPDEKRASDFSANVGRVNNGAIEDAKFVEAIIDAHTHSLTVVPVPADSVLLGSGAFFFRLCVDRERFVVYTSRFDLLD